MTDYTLDRPVAITCPDCGGALRRMDTGTLTQFRCHIGHVYTAEVMAAAQFAALEGGLAATLRSLSERAELCRQMAGKSQAAGQAETTARWDAAAREAETRVAAVRELLEADWTHPDPIDAAGATDE